MGCNCNNGMSPTRIDTAGSWNTLITMKPVDPLDLIAFASLGSTTGVWALTTTFATPTAPSTWVNTPISVASEVIISSNNSSTAQNVFDATSYNFSNISVNVGAAVAPPLRKLVFMRAGEGWSNLLPLSILGSPNVVEVQLSFLENAATRGDCRGTYPVIQWPSPEPYTGVLNLELTFKRSGRFALGILTIDNNSTPGYGMFELDVVAV